MFDLKSIKKIHFIGIGGIGMSALAGMAKGLGFEVSGSDDADIYPPGSLVLEKYGIKYNVPYKRDNLKNPDLVVIGGGIKEDNPEVLGAGEQKIPIISFPEFLYKISKNESRTFLGKKVRDKYRIVVTGTHGKTTVSAMIAWILKEAGDKPSFFVGGVLKNLGANSEVGSGKYLVIEGDEYFTSVFDKTPKFLHYHPHFGVITSLEMDHFDVYKSFNDLKNAFQKFVRQIPASGFFSFNAEDKNLEKFESAGKKISFGIEKGDFQAKNISFRGAGASFDAEFQERILGKIELKVPGILNIKNALAAISAAYSLGVNIKKIKKALANFSGVARRFDIRGEKRGIMVVDDYAHHPTAVRATIEAARAQFGNRRIWAIFEPHTFSRTKETLVDLATAFSKADFVIIPDIYAAREEGMKGLVDSKQVVAAIKKNQPNSFYIPTKEKVLEFVLPKLKENDIVIVMAVGSFNKLADEILEKI